MFSVIWLLQKGIKASVAKKLSFGKYVYCLSSLSPKHVDIKRIGWDLHRVFMYSTENIGLSVFDIKRWICDVVFLPMYLDTGNGIVNFIYRAVFRDVDEVYKYNGSSNL